jgi:VCBS repeat-containing protein
VSGEGTVNFSSGATNTIAGNYDLTGPTNISAYGVAFNSDITTPSTINLISGSLDGSGNFTMTGLFTWSGGEMRGTGTTTANGGISITTAAGKSLNRTLNNNGTCTCDYAGSSFSFYLSGIFNNQAGAIFNLPTDVTISSIGGVFNNYGAFNRTTSSGTAAIGLEFNNSGTVNVQSGTLSFAGAYVQTGAGSSIALNGGSLHISNPLSIPEGTLKGSGNITGSVTIGAAGAVNIELGGTTPGINATDYDQLNITGAASLAGTLNVSLTGVFTPSIGNTFTIMTFASHTGTFATTNLPSLGGGRAWGAVAYSSGSVVLSVVAGSNHAPTAVNDAYSTNEDTALNQAASGVLGNDTDSDGDALTAVKVTDPGHGTVTLNSNGSFTYTPTPNYSGLDTFTYKANDGTADSAVVTVNITVNGVNDAPVAPAGGVAYSTDENAVLNQAAPGVLGTVTDADGNPLTAILVTTVSHGTLVLNPNGSFTYTPAAGFTGSDSFTCKANDGAADSGVFTVTIEVTQGEPPTITSLSKSSGHQGKRLTVFITGTNLDGATELDFGAGITVNPSFSSSPTQITAEITIGSDAALGTRDVLVRTPKGSFTLEDAFTVKKASSGGMPVWVWPVAALAVIAAGAGGFFLLFILPRRKAKKAD